MEQIEIERKYLVKFESWQQLFSLLENIVAIKRIEQIYLSKNKTESSSRIRKTVEGFKNKKIYFDINHKSKIDNLSRKEKEKRISESEFNSLLKYKDNSRLVIKKTRILFNYKDQLFELDLFKDKLSGLVILEIELDKRNEKVNLPPYFKVLKEVTKEEKFNNYHLSDKKVKGYKNGKIIKD